MLKKLAYTLASAFLLYQSFGLISALPNYAEYNWTNSILLAALLNLFVTGIFAFAGFAWPTESVMPKTYYDSHNRRRLKYWYRVLGLKYFRLFLLATFWRSKAKQAGYFDGTVKGIKGLYTSACKAEFGHLWPFVIINSVAFYLLYLGHWNVALLAIVINVFFNFYPILLRRHHRLRIQILVKRHAHKFD